MDYVANIFHNVYTSVSSFLWAVILLIIAFVVAKIVKGLVTKLLNAVHAEKYLSKLGIKDVSTGSEIEFVAKLAYFVTFLLFLPAVLDKLGMQSVSAPITGMVNRFLGFIPNLVGAAIIVGLGVFLAKLVRQLLLSVLRAVKVDELQKKFGIEATEKTAFSTLIANIIYALLLLVILTSALDELGIAAISSPAKVIVASIFSIFPNVLAAIAIVAVGVFIAQLVAKLLESLLAGVGADALLDKISPNSGKKIVLSKTIGTVVKIVLIVIFLVQGINVLNLEVLTVIGSAVIAYLPKVLAAVIILAIGLFAANAVQGALEKKFPAAKGAILAAKIAIYVLVAFMCLSQLGIATKIVETAFVLFIAAACVAFALAFGLGGKKFAGHVLTALEEKHLNGAPAEKDEEE